MCQPMPTVFYTRCDLDWERNRFASRQHETRSFEIMFMYSLNEQDQKVELEASALQTDRKKETVTVLIYFVLLETLCSKQ